jgi:hypothetical protein
MIEFITSMEFVTGFCIMMIVSAIIDSAYRGQLTTIRRRLELKDEALDFWRDEVVAIRSLMSKIRDENQMLYKEINQAGLELCRGSKRSFIRRKRYINNKK